MEILVAFDLPINNFECKTSLKLVALYIAELRCEDAPIVYQSIGLFDPFKLSKCK